MNSHLQRIIPVGIPDGKYAGKSVNFPVSGYAIRLPGTGKLARNEINNKPTHLRF